MAKKTILYLITQSELGGAQRYCFDLAKNLKSEFNVIIAFGEQGEQGSLAKKLEASKITYYTIPYLQRSISPIKDFRALLEIIKLIKKVKPDIIHLNSSKISILGSLATFICKLLIVNCKLSVIYTAHGWVFNEPLSFSKRTFYKYAEKFTSLFKNKIICVSNFDYQTALANKIAPKEKLITIHNGIAPIDFFPRQEAREKLNLDNNEFIIGSIGNLYKTKGFKYLVEAMKQLIDSGIDAKTIIIGEGPERQNLEKLITDYNLGNQVILAGRIQQAAELLSAFDIYVCSSVKEGLSYTIIETMLNGLPTIATRVGGNPELIEDNETGFLIKPQDSSELANKIEEIITASDLAQDLSAKTRIKAQEEFNLDKMINKTKKVYNFLSH